MKLVPFEFIAATSVDMAAAALADGGDDAKIIAGGQSLVPLLNFRFLRPSILIDINRIESLAFISETATDIRVGALTRHYQLETSPVIARHLPVLPCAMTHVAHLAIRTRGTTAAAWRMAIPPPTSMMALLLDAELHIGSVAAARITAARDFFLDACTVDLNAGEIVTEIALPKLPPQTGWGFAEVSRRRGDFALAAAAATLAVAAGAIVEARIALSGIGRTAVRAATAESLLVGHALEPPLVSQAIEAVRAAIGPDTDLHASADYRRHLAGVLTGRALAAAWRRANESAA